MDIFLDVGQKKNKSSMSVRKEGLLHSPQKRRIALFSRNACPNWASCRNNIVKLSLKSIPASLSDLTKFYSYQETTGFLTW